MFYVAIVWICGRRVLDQIYPCKASAQSAIDAEISYWYNEQDVPISDIEQMIEEIT